LNDSYRGSGVRRALPIVVLAVAGFGCGPEEPAPAPPPTKSSAPKPAAPKPAAPAPADKPLAVQFVDLHEDRTGFGPVNHTGVPNDKQWIAEAMGGGILLFDYDGDGDMDVLAVDGNVVARDPLPDARTRLFRNDGGFKFTDVTEAAHIDIRDVGYGGAAADFDDDGDVDAFVGVLGKDHLLRNNGDGTFTDVAAEAGVQGDARDMSTGACWADFDGNGRLDLYVSNYVDMQRVVEEYAKEGRAGRSCDWRGFKVYCGPMNLPFQLDRLFLSEGPDPATGVVRFRDATANLKDQVPCPSFQPVAADFDADGDIDIFVANDTQPNHFWVNDGKGNFHDDAWIAGCAVDASTRPQAGMGVDVSDYDHDGLLDIVVTNFSHDYNTLHHNESVPRTKGGGLRAFFRDVSTSTGVAQPTFYPLGWVASFTDFDGDGDRDLFFSCGHVFGEIDNFTATGTSYRQKNLLLENGGGMKPTFSDVSPRAGPGFQVQEVHRGGVAGDLDDDGDEDFVLAVLNGKAYMLRNDGGNANAWIRLSLLGKKPRDPCGALVKVEAEGILPQWDVVLRGDSFLSCSDPRLLFGLRAATKASRVTVTWPSGAKGSWENLDARAHWLLEEGVPAAKKLPK
jgi:hypothetical protein